MVINMANETVHNSSIKDLFLDFENVAKQSLSAKDYATLKPFINVLQQEICNDNDVSPEQVLLTSNKIEDLLEALLLTSK